jgi:uncharacterized protein YegP (UPF0339 family)
MSARQPRFEVVRADAGWFARFVAANGQKVWQTEVYTRRGKALHAIELIADAKLYFSPFADHPEISRGGQLLEVRHIDERTAP